MTLLKIELFDGFQVKCEDKEVSDFPTTKTRGLLAYLAVEGQDHQPRDTLAYLLWPDSTTKRAKANLSTTLSKLRKVLKTAVLKTRSQEDTSATTVPKFFSTVGHQTIGFDPDKIAWIDVIAFENMVDTGCQAHPDYDSESCTECIKRLKQGVELYQGDFLKAEFIKDAAPFEQWLLVRKENLKKKALKALTHLTAYHLQLSEKETIPQRLQTTLEHAQIYAQRQLELDPEREEAHQQLMRALALNGQRQQALKQYEKCVRALREMGVEPTEETTALYKEIQDDKLKLRPSLAAPDAQLKDDDRVLSNEPLFVGVPPKPEHFVGREDLLSKLRTRLINGENLVLEGLPGVGKTTLAVELASNKELLQHFSDGVLWAALGQKPNVLRVLARWGQALGRDVTHLMDEAERAEAVKDAIGQRRLLLVIDDAWDAKDTKWLRLGGPYSSHLLTTRDKAIARRFKAQVVTVPVLEEEPAFDLLQTLAPEACATDPAKARELVQAVGRLPLALELLGGYLNAPEHSLFPELAEEAIVEMSDPQLRLRLASQRLGSFTSPEVTLQETIELSLANLPAKTVAAFHALGAFAPKPADFDRQAASAVTGADPRTLAFLMARNLIERTGKRLTLHQTLADVARTKLDEQALQRHRHYYLTFAQTHAARKADAWDKLEKELPNLLLAVERAAKVKDLDAMISFEEALIHQGQLLYTRGYYQEAITLLSQSLDVQKVQKQAQYQPRTFNKLAFFYMRLDKEKTAEQHAEAAHDLAKTLGDQEQQADSLKYSAIIIYTRGEIEEARIFFEKELTLRHALSSRPELADCFNSLGMVELAAGNYAKAKHRFDEAIKGFEKLDNPSRLAMYVCNRGLPSLYLGNYSAAMKDFESALEQSRAIGDRYIMPSTLLNKGVLHSYLGQYSLALQCLKEALPIYQKVKRQSSEVLTLGTLAEVYSALGDHQQAISYLQEAGQKIAEIERREIKVDYHNKRGVVEYQQGHYEEAEEAYQKADTLTEGAKTKYYAQIQTKLGLLQTSLAKSSQQDLENARQYAHEAIALCQEMQLAGNEPRAHAYLGKANLLLGDKETALKNAQEAIRLLQEQQFVHSSEAEIYLHAVHILAANGQTEEEQQHIEHAYRLVQEIAAKTEDDTLRQSYLATPTNREISETWQRLQASKST